MKLLIYDQNITFSDSIKEKYDRVVYADGRYAPCRGCFKCWTKTPATCEMKDSLYENCSVMIITACGFSGKWIKEIE